MFNFTKYGRRLPFLAGPSILGRRWVLQFWDTLYLSIYRCIDIHSSTNINGYTALRINLPRYQPPDKSPIDIGICDRTGLQLYRPINSLLSTYPYRPMYLAARQSVDLSISIRTSISMDINCRLGIMVVRPTTRYRPIALSIYQRIDIPA